MTAWGGAATVRGMWEMQRLLAAGRPLWGRNPSGGCSDCLGCRGCSAGALSVRGTWRLQRLLALQGRLGGCSDCQEHLGAAAIWLQGTRELQRL